MTALEKILAQYGDAWVWYASDELRHYERALLETYGIVQEVPRQTGKRGRPPKPKLIPPPELRYAQVVKKRKKGRVVSIETAVVFLLTNQNYYKKLFTKRYLKWVPLMN